MTCLSRSLSLAAFTLALAGGAVADTVRVTGDVTAYGPPEYDGSFVLTFDVDRSLLPAVNDPVNHGGQVPISDVDFSIEYKNGVIDQQANGTGRIDPFSPSYSVLEFTAGNVSGSFGVPVDYNGTQDLEPNAEGSTTSFLRDDTHEGILISGQSALVDTPEPTTSSLAGLALTALGWFGARSRRKASVS